jgi:hypothetical protein
MAGRTTDSVPQEQMKDHSGQLSEKHLEEDSLEHSEEHSEEH